MLKSLPDDYIQGGMYYDRQYSCNPQQTGG